MSRRRRTYQSESKRAKLSHDSRYAFANTRLWQQERKWRIVCHAPGHEQPIRTDQTRWRDATFDDLPV